MDAEAHLPVRDRANNPVPQTPDLEGEVAFSQQLVDTVARGQGVGAVARLLSRQLDAPVCLLDLRGSILSQTPDRASWPVAEILAYYPRSSWIEEVAVSVVPVRTGGEVVALLCSTADSEFLPLLRLSAGVAAMELGRLQALVSGRRDLVARLLEDIVTGAIPDAEAAQRVKQFGVDLSGDNHVLLGQVDCSRERLEAFPWNLRALITQRNEPYLRATMNDRLLLVVPSAAEVQAVAQLALRHLSQLGPGPRLGIGGSHTGVRGIRIGYYEAVDGLEQGPGINQQTRLNIGSALIASNVELPMYELAQAALQPLMDYDDEHATDLMRTLREFLQADCSVGIAAQRLFLHRNTLRYRLNQIQHLTGRDPFTLSDQVHFWLAAHVLKRRTG